MIKLVFRAMRGTLALSCIAMLAMLRVPAAGKEEAASAPPTIACEIRYHFRERLGDAKPGGKQFSAPAFEKEALPASRQLLSKGQQARLVEGRVAHLPYRFAIKWTSIGGTDAGKLEVNVLDATGKPLLSYPQTMENPFAQAANPSSREFEIPTGPKLLQTIEKSLLGKNQHLTRVELVIKSSP